MRITHHRVRVATFLSLWLIIFDRHRGHRNIVVRNTFRKRSYDSRGIVLCGEPEPEKYTVSSGM